MQQTAGPLHHSARDGDSGAANGVARARRSTMQRFADPLHRVHE